MPEYVTTNIRLPKAMHERIRQVALLESKSMAEVIRESLTEYLIEPRLTLSAAEADEFDDPFYHIAELTRPEEVIWGDRPTDTSVRHDFYLYGVDLDEIPKRGAV
ncbi:MAG: ribbon-helix-helix protein, CopG family [Chloroflexi bacterium]|nr:ribbon-helix-helix protein, CopG family [Chloroflexota bacterium]